MDQPAGARAPTPPSPSGGRRIQLRLSGFYAGYFLVVGVLLPFWPLYLEAKGMSARQIGLLLALTLWLRLAGPLIARLADRTGHTRRPLIACALSAFALAFAFFWTDGFWPLLLASMAFFFAFSSTLPLAETLSLRLVSVHTGYGRVRLWGSVAFVAAAVLGGFVLERRGSLSAETIVVLVLGALVAMTVAALFMPEARPQATPGATAPLKRLLKSRVFLLFLATTALIHAAHTVYYGFASLHWAAAGIAKSTIGLLWAESTVAEILLFAFGGPLVLRLGPVNLFLIAALAGVVRWTILALTAELWWLAIAQLLHGATFGAMHLGAMMFIVRAVPAAAANSAQSLFAGVTHGAALGLGLLLAGVLYQAFAGDAYWANVGLSALAVGVALWAASVRS
jgi:PPP family 3-phenylpropionic acid transporter